MRQDSPPTALCGCFRAAASASERLGRPACARCYFRSFSAAEREASDRAWARKALAGQVRAAAKSLEWDDPRAVRLRDLALDLELAGSDHVAAPVLDGLRTAGLRLEMRS